MWLCAAAQLTWLVAALLIHTFGSQQLLSTWNGVYNHSQDQEMGGYGGFVGLPDSAACMHLTPLSPQHSGLDPGAYFHELSRLWKVENEVVFFFPR